MQPQDKLFLVSFNERLLEERRTNQRSPSDDGISNRHNQLWSIRMDSTRHLLKKMKFNSQFTINYKEEQLMTPEAERFNGWAAMLGFVAAVGAYATTGNIIPGIF